MIVGILLPKRLFRLAIELFLMGSKLGGLTEKYDKTPETTRLLTTTWMEIPGYRALADQCGLALNLKHIFYDPGPLMVK